MMRFGIRTMSYRLEGVDESTERLGRSCIWIVWWEDRTQVISILSRDNPLHRQDWLTDMHKLKKVEFKSTRYLGRYTFPTFINLFLSFPISFSPLGWAPMWRCSIIDFPQKGSFTDWYKSSLLLAVLNKTYPTQIFPHYRALFVSFKIFFWASHRCCKSSSSWFMLPSGQSDHL